MKQVFELLLTLTFASLLSACIGGGVPYPTVWYDVYGTVCGSKPGPGCNYYEDGTKITYTMDPYYNSEWKDDNFHYSWDCDDSSDPFCTEDAYTDVNPEQYYRNFLYFDSYGNAKYYTGYGWQSPSGIFYNDNGSALNDPNAEDDWMDRDIVGNVASIEQQVIQAAGRDYAERYALSEDTGLRVARVVNDWALVGKGRARTEADIKDFTQRLYGVDFKKVTVSLDSAKNGDTSKFANVLVDMAEAWGTNPETAHRVLKNSYGSVLKEYNLD